MSNMDSTMTQLIGLYDVTAYSCHESYTFVGKWRCLRARCWRQYLIEKES